MSKANRIRRYGDNETEVDAAFLSSHSMCTRRSLARIIPAYAVASRGKPIAANVRCHLIPCGGVPPAVPLRVVRLRVLVRAARVLEDLADLRRQASPEQRAELAQTLFAEVRVRDSRTIGATLAHPEHLPLVASATARNSVGMAPPDGLWGTGVTCRPTGVVRAICLTPGLIVPPPGRLTTIRLTHPKGRRQVSTI